MPLPFLTRHRELLTAAGAMRPLEDQPGIGPPLLLLARELCSFAWFETGKAQGSAAVAAARLHARATAPFANPGILLQKGPGGHAIWSWNMDVVGPAVAERFGDGKIQLAPETLAQPPGEGWRIVRMTPGYEAQCWMAGSLVGSLWRRDPFDENAWRSFVRVQKGPPAPDAPPPAAALPFSRAPSGGVELTEISGPGLWQAAGAVTATALLALIGLSVGQAWRLSNLAKASEIRASAVRAAMPASEAPGQGAFQRLAAFRKLSDRPDALAALSTALGILKLFNVEPKGFQVDGEALTLTLPYSAIGKVNRIIAELGGAGRFTDVQPRTDADAQTITVTLKLARTPPPASG